MCVFYSVDLGFPKPHANYTYNEIIINTIEERVERSEYEDREMANSHTDILSGSDQVGLLIYKVMIKF